MRGRTSLSATMILVLSFAGIFVLGATLTAQEPSEKPSAADLFERTLAAEGLDAALARLNETLADTPGAGIYASFRRSDSTWSPAVFLHDRLTSLTSRSR